MISQPYKHTSTQKEKEFNIFINMLKYPIVTKPTQVIIITSILLLLRKYINI